MGRINIILYQPEIPQNTGNIMRTCVGFDMKLHLIRPLGFHISHKDLMRSALDYYEYIDYTIYDDWNDFNEKNKGANIFYLTRYGKKQITDFDFTALEGDIYLMFGRESTGIPYDILANHLDHCFRIPTTDKIRSLNLSNCVAMASHEVLRQLEFEGLIKHEPDSLKGENFLDQFKEKM